LKGIDKPLGNCGTIMLKGWMGKWSWKN